MPIVLTTPLEFYPGRGQSGEIYEQAKIVGFEAIIEPAEDTCTTIRVQYGNTVDGVWVPGQLPIEYVVIQDVPAIYGTELDGEGNPVVLREADLRYTNWVGSTNPISTSNLLYTEIAIALYSFLLTQEGFEGTIV